MLVTENQAALLLCVRGLPEGITCFGSRCMAWRWAESWRQLVEMPANHKDSCSEAEPPRPPTLPQSWTWSPPGDFDDLGCWVEPANEALARRMGYCGLAGKVKY